MQSTGGISTGALMSALVVIPGTLYCVATVRGLTAVRMQTMTTRSGRRIVNPRELLREVERLLRADPDLSVSAITGQLRASGVGARDQRIRAAVRTSRVQQLRAADSILGQALAASPVLTTALDILGLPGGNLVANAIGFRTQLKELGATVAAGSNLETSTHVSLDWRVTYTASIYAFGEKLDTVSRIVTGRNVADLRFFDRTVIESRAAQKIVGQLAEEFERDTEGIEVVFDKFDIALTSVQFRGGPASRRR